MSLNGLPSLIEDNCKFNGSKRDFFDLLGFPDEVIDKFFSYLTVEDRLKMRLNKRLHKIEAQSKYFIEGVKLKSDLDETKCVIIKDRFYPFDFIKRIAHITSIGVLQIDLPESVEVARKFYNIIEEFRCFRELSIYFRSWKRAEIMKFFLWISRRCESLTFDCNIINISPENLHDMYKIVIDDSICLRYFKFHKLKLKTVREFLNLRGITYNNGQVSSSRNIEAYMSSTHDLENEYYVNIVDGWARIIFASSDEEDDWGTSIEITFNKDQKSLSRFKYNTSLMERKRNGDIFDLLGCPDEVIDKFFSYLDFEDRMRMRLNKRLSKIEAESKYYVDMVELRQQGDEKCVFIEKIRYSIEFIERIAHNLSIGELVVGLSEKLYIVQDKLFKLTSTDGLYYKFLDLIKEFKKFELLNLDFGGVGEKTVNKILVDEFFKKLDTRCNRIFLRCNRYMQFNDASLDTLLHLFKCVKEGSTNLRQFISCSHVDHEDLNAFLNSLGIAYKNGRVITNKSIEAYKDSYPPIYFGGGYIVHIFDEFFHIYFRDTEVPGEYADFKFELLKNPGALNSAKNPPLQRGVTRARMDVYPE